MNQEIDKIFRDKLETFQKPASADAWDKLERSLNRKQHKAIWLKIAAAITLLATAAYMLWPQHETSNNYQFAQLSDKTNNKKEEKISSTHPKTDLNQYPTSNTAAVSIVKKNPNHNLGDHKKTIIAIQSDRLLESKITDDSTTNNIDVALPPVENIEVAVNEPLQNNSTTIIYKVEEVNEKYLVNNSFEEATSAQKKTSTFKKMLNKAKGLKNNQDPFGDLRQKKNEILALNFSKEKRKQN